MGRDYDEMEDDNPIEQDFDETENSDIEYCERCERDIEHCICEDENNFVEFPDNFVEFPNDETYD